MPLKLTPDGKGHRAERFLAASGKKRTVSLRRAVRKYLKKGDYIYIYIFVYIYIYIYMHIYIYIYIYI